MLVDMQLIEQPKADHAQHGLHGRRRRVDQLHRASSPLVVPSGVPQSIDHRVEDLAGKAAQLAGPQGEFHLSVEDPRRQRPVDLIEADEEVGDLGHDIGLGHDSAPTDDDVVVEEGIRQGIVKRGEMALRELGIADLGQQILIRAGNSQMRAPSSSVLASRG